MANKPLTIDVAPAAIPPGTMDAWTPLGNTSVFITNILTPKLSKGTNIAKLVSGIPTAFARVDLFKTALDYVASHGASNEMHNLVGYYTLLVEEWKGLIACMALDYAHISVRRIDLTYSDGESIAETYNVYEPKGAFGNMLLRRSKRWCEQDIPESATAVPFINVIKYKGKVVGATAPECLLFTSSGYKCEPSEGCPWIDPATGRFIDPLRSAMEPVQVATLHAYVSHLLSGLNDLQLYYSSLPKGEGVDYTSIRTILTNWQAAIAQRAKTDGIELSIGSVPPVSADFGGPFKKLFCHTDILYGVEGMISDRHLNGGVEFDPNNLLLEDNARIAKLDLNIRPDELNKLPILVLSADVKDSDKKAYFALPFSAQGLNVFGQNVSTLIGMANSETVKSRLSATYDPSRNTGNLEVELTLITSSGSRRRLKKIYTSNGSIENKDILIWPNFISPQWKSYYMYSELPHNGTSQSYRAYPFVGEMQDNYFRIIVDNKQNPILLGKDVKDRVDIKSEILIKCDETVADNSYKYEIYYSNKPFKGVRLLAPTGDEGGYLLINYKSSLGSTLPHDWMLPGSRPALQEVRLGVDFGSTNTSIAYSSDSGEEGFELTNLRVSLFGNELPGHPILPKENQVFFFQGAGPAVKSNAIKSVLTLHDNRRLPDLKPGETVKQRNEKEIVGGFPSFADNLPFFSSTNKTITLSYPNGVGDVTQIHNMKWEDTDDDKAHKSAFLRTLMLQVYAALFAKGLVPTSVKWSYPSAMSGQLLISYDQIWQQLNSVTPVYKTDGEKYPLSVSRYTDTTSLSNKSKGFGSNTSASANTGSGFGASGFGGGFGTSFGGGFNAGATAPAAAPGASAPSGFGNGFQSSPAPQPAPAQPEEDMQPDDPDKEVVYDPKPMYTMDNAGDNPSLSEAEAVANYVTKTYAQEANMLNLCFDVGGSTTDITALFYLKGNVTMIKQNSLRFAAQRVSQAVSHFPRFKNVLTSICAMYKIQMVGLNYGPDTYSAATAPYFFDQIVSRLDDDQLQQLYRSISAECPLLMCVNMYVTGLLMYYAGQIASKLVDDLYHTSQEEWQARQRPRVRVTFAGKGSRLFQWLSTVNPGAARDYYGNLFVMGYGQEHMFQTLADYQDIVLPKLHDPEIKFEVSKGLAKGDTTLQRPATVQPSEIIGESGYELIGNDHVRRPIKFTNSITPGMIQSIGIRLTRDTATKNADKFTEFCGFFYSAAHQLFNWNVNPTVLEKACREMAITAYVQNMPEFRAAAREAASGNPFNFVAPVIILEGMKFFEDTLLKLLK